MIHESGFALVSLLGLAFGLSSRRILNGSSGLDLGLQLLRMLQMLAEFGQHLAGELLDLLVRMLAGNRFILLNIFAMLFRDESDERLVELSAGGLNQLLDFLHVHFHSVLLSKLFQLLAGLQNRLLLLFRELLDFAVLTFLNGEFAECEAKVAIHRRLLHKFASFRHSLAAGLRAGGLLQSLLTLQLLLRRALLWLLFSGPGAGRFLNLAFGLGLGLQPLHLLQMLAHLVELLPSKLLNLLVLVPAGNLFEMLAIFLPLLGDVAQISVVELPALGLNQLLKLHGVE
jgi:hypothetical protein